MPDAAQCGLQRTLADGASPSRTLTVPMGPRSSLEARGWIIPYADRSGGTPASVCPPPHNIERVRA